MQYENISKLSAGVVQGVRKNNITESFVASGELPFGEAAFGYPGNQEVASGIVNNAATLDFDAGLVTGNITTVTIDGLVTEPVTFDTDAATTYAALIAEIEALEEGMAATVALNVITVVREGQILSVTVDITGGTPPTVTVAYTTGGDIAFIGPVVKAQKAPTDNAASNYGYIDQEELEVLREGYITVAVDDIANCEVLKPVYVITSGADAGKFTGTVGSNLLINASFQSLGDGSQDLATIYISQKPIIVS